MNEEVKEEGVNHVIEMVGSTFGKLAYKGGMVI